MRLSKRLLAQPWAQALVAAAVAGLVRLVRWSCRVTVIGAEHRDELDAAGGAYLACFWHGRMLMIPFERRRAFAMLISAHRDGRLIARAMRALGVETIEGSSTRGGVDALRRMIRALRAGTCVGVTPDGPRGPRMRLKPGAVAAAQAAGVPLLPVAYSASRGRFLGSWDRLLAPAPFARLVYVIGAPIHPRADETAEDLRRRVEDALNAVTAEADRRAGRAPIAPAPEAVALPLPTPKPERSAAPDATA